MLISNLSTIVNCLLFFVINQNDDKVINVLSNVHASEESQVRVYFRPSKSCSRE